MTSLDTILEKYRPLGRMRAGELLLTPDLALRLAEEVVLTGVQILGVDLWKRFGDDFGEDPGGMDLSGVPAAESVKLAKSFISNHLPSDTDCVSFVFGSSTFLDELDDD